VSSLVILSAAVFEISCRKTDRQTDNRLWKLYPHDCHWRG